MKVEFTQIRKHIIDEINKAKNSIFVAVAWFTSEELFASLITLLEKGIIIELIINNDHINNRLNGLDLNKFIKYGGKLFFAHNSSLMHHKFVIIDNEMLLTGSYNWTYNAEFRNDENIILTKNTDLINKFKKEFDDLKQLADHQNENEIVPAKKNFDFDIKLFLKSDFLNKSIDEERRGDLEKSLKTIIKVAEEIDSEDTSIQDRIAEIKKKIKNPEYHYHVEDGQFSFDFVKNKLLGKEGEVIKLHTIRTLNNKDEIYILFIDGFYIECIGNVERSFPKDFIEHEELKQRVKDQQNSFENSSFNSSKIEDISSNVNTLNIALTPIKDVENILCFQIKFKDTLYNRGILNIPVRYSESFQHLTAIDIYLGNSNVPIKILLDRNSNKKTSNAPRINGGKELTSWFQENFILGETLTVHILSKTSLRLTK